MTAALSRALMVAASLIQAALAALCVFVFVAPDVLQPFTAVDLASDPWGKVSAFGVMLLLLERAKDVLVTA